MTPSALRRCAPWLLAGVSYTALAIVLTWPLAARVSSVLPHDLGDPVLNTWILWWNAHTVPLTAAWWNAPIFWPTGGALAFSEHLLGISLVASPMQWMGGSPVTAYNVVFLLSFPLSALAAHALGHTLTGRHDAAAVAGLAFGFNPYRIAQSAHLQMLTAFGMPAALFALHQYLRRRDRRWLWLFGAAWLQQALSNGYYLVFFPVLLVLWCAWFLSAADRRASIGIAGAFALSSVPLLSLLSKYREIHAALDFHRTFDEIQEFSADAAGLLSASPLVALWGRVASFRRPEGELYPGLTIVVLVAIIVALWVRRLPWQRRTPRWQALALTVSIACTAVALSAMALGPWSIVVAGVKLLSVGAAHKPLSLGLLFFAIAVVFDPRVVRAAAARPPVMFYIAATAALYLLSFGPRPKFLGAPFVYQAPYEWLMRGPGFDSLRVPARFAMVALVCLSAAAAMAFARLTASLGHTARRTAALLVLGAVLGESWITRMPLPLLPTRLSTLESLPNGAVVMELPLGYVDRDTEAMFRAMYHRHPLVNGYSGFAPPEYTVFALGLAAGDRDVLDVMMSAGPLVVAIDERDGNGRDWSAAIAQRAGVSLVGAEAGHRVFSIPATPPVESRQPDQSLRIQSVSANVYQMDAARMVDGDLHSRWETRQPQRGTEIVMVDLGSIHSVTGVTLWLGPYVFDYPRLLRIDCSEDGLTWTERWQGRTAALAMAGATRNRREVPLRVSLMASPARFVRLREAVADPLYRWSIGEVAVFGR